MCAIKYIKEFLPHVKIHLYVPDFFFELAKYLVPNICIRPFSKRYKYNNGFACIKTQCPQHDTLATHLVDHAFHLLVNKQVEIEHKNYIPLKLSNIKLKNIELPKKYFCLTTGFTAPVREFLPNVINQIVDYLEGKGYSVVWLGSNNAPVMGMADAIRGTFKEDINYTKGLNLLNKTTLLEAGKIIANSEGIIGVDNGLMHLAGCTEVPIIGGFTTVEPKFRNPYRHNELGWNCFNVTPNDALRCRFCQSNWSLVYDFDFRKCFYEDYACTQDLFFEKWKEQLDKVMR